MSASAYRAPSILLLCLYGTWVSMIVFSPISIDHFVRFALDAFTDWTSEHPKIAWLDFRAIERVSNVIVFVPLGTFLSLIAGLRWFWTAIPILLLASAEVELIQGALLADRVSSPVDILANSIGAVLGTLIGLAILIFERSRSRSAPLISQQISANTEQFFAELDDERRDQ
ncbi:VanZ family protein [Agreia sp. PsM10]|uniref:VanZ family protein n=1 Tax=Agreia sp. PsM10 TaxID=3030533 RepID=UPI00263BBD81|nr:VanZ family protein [Agreia sp. PsM10]MDN4641969.1 VanZ family protein [Agreia sp. PsM10]